MNQRLDCKTYSHKTKTNVGSKLLYMGLGYDISESDSKSKNKQMGLHWTKKLLHNKRNQQN